MSSRGLREQQQGIGFYSDETDAVWLRRGQQWMPSRAQGAKNHV